MPDLPRSSLRAIAMAGVVGGMLAVGPLLAGCGITKTYTRGYILPQGALEQVPIGASQEQVLIILGTPSTVATNALPCDSPAVVKRKCIRER